MKNLFTILLVMITNCVHAYSYTIYCMTSYVVGQGWVVNCYVSESPCSDHFGADYCREYNAMAINPNIYVDGSGGAVLSDNGRNIRIESDEIKVFFGNNKDAWLKNSISKEELQRNFGKLTKADAGKVSKERIAQFAKDLGARIIKVDKLPETNYCPSCAIKNKQAPETDREKMNAATETSKNVILNFSTGGIFTQNDILGNGFNVQADAFVPLYSKGNFAFGASIGVNYAGIKNSFPDNSAVAGKYQVNSAMNTVSTNETGNSSGSLSGLAGIQAMFGLGKFYISPLISTGYSNFRLQGFTQIGTYSANGQSKDIDLVKREKQSSGGMIFKPQLKIGYKISPSVSVFVSSAYIVGPEIKYTIENWVPQGGFNSQNMYETGQMQNGSWAAMNSSEKFKAVEVNLGLSFAIGNRQHKPETIGGSGGMSSTDSTDGKPETPTTHEHRTINKNSNKLPIGRSK
ncbi:hypothetical protein [Chryseobacterium joostei]|uniref:hypothetical protein n=1 Tax=Chryseobacterium joostei TaxID=112234 RepID=UPI003D1472D0